MARFDISNVIHKPDIRGSISLFGRMLITLGLILLLFVAYQLWGTNEFTRRSQDSLRDKFKTKVEKAKIDKKNNSGSTTTTSPDGKNDPNLKPDKFTVDQLKQDVVRGEPIAIIKIPKIGLDHVVVSGTDRTSLQKGPGHYPATPLPGQFGNSAIAGHRTTYGAPFGRQDELAVGDKIILKTVRGTFTYEVDKQNTVVSPSDVSVIEPTVDKSDPSGKTFLPTLTLTTCHPKYSAAKRLITTAKLIDGSPTVAAQLFDKYDEVPKTINIGEDDSSIADDDIGHSNILVAMLAASLLLPLLWWLLLFVAVGSIWWYLFKKYHNWKIWVAGVLPFAIVMLLYFIQLERALPSNI